MANVIEIVVNAKNNASAVLKQAAGDADRLGLSFASVTTIAGLAGTALLALGAAAFNSARKFSDAVEQLGNLSAVTGVSVGNLQVADQAMKNLGLSTGTLQTALRFLNRNIGENDATLRSLGITTRDTWTAFNQVLDVLSKMQDQGARTKLAFDLFGRGGVEVLATVGKLRGEMEHVDTIFTAVGSKISGDVLTAAGNLDRQIDDLNTHWAAFSTTLSVKFLPAVTAVVEAMNLLVSSTKEAQDAANKRFAEGLTKPGDIGFGVGAGGPQIFPSPPPTPRERTTFFDQIQTEFGRRGLPPEAGIRPSEKIEMPELRESDIQAVLGKWHKFVNEITSSAGTLNEALGTVQNSLEGSFSNVFAGLLDSSQTFSSALKTIFHSLASDILAEIGRLAAIRIFGGILGLVGNLIPGGGGGLTSGVGGVPSNFGLRAGGGTQININTLDAKSLREQLGGPGGSLYNALLRRAQALA